MSLIPRLESSDYVSCDLVYDENCRHLEPYLNAKTGMGARQKLSAPNNVKPQPYPKESISGPVVRGRKVPIRHLVTMTPVSAEAEKRSKASTTYASRGRKAKSNVNPSSATEKSKRGNGSRSWAIQPYRMIDRGSVKPPMIASGSRYSGWPGPFLESRSRTYIRSSVRLQMLTLMNEPTPVRHISTCLLSC